MKCRLFVLTCVFALLAAGTTFGQAKTTNTLSGVVVDNTGAIVPGASVAVKHNATGVTQSSVTNSETISVLMPVLTTQGARTHRAGCPSPRRPSAESPRPHSGKARPPGRNRVGPWPVGRPTGVLYQAIPGRSWPPLSHGTRGVNLVQWRPPTLQIDVRRSDRFAR